MMINGEEYKLDVPATIVNGRTFIPLRRLVEDVLGKKVFYNKGLIIISDEENIIDSETEKEMVDKVIELLK